MQMRYGNYDNFAFIKTVQNTIRKTFYQAASYLIANQQV